MQQPLFGTNWRKEMHDKRNITNLLLPKFFTVAGVSLHSGAQVIRHRNKSNAFPTGKQKKPPDANRRFFYE
jgi:hypothetical protein